MNDMRFHFCNVVSDIVQRACLTVHPISNLNTVLKRSANTARLAKAKFMAAFIAKIGLSSTE